MSARRIERRLGFADIAFQPERDPDGGQNPGTKPGLPLRSSFLWLQPHSGCEMLKRNESAWSSLPKRLLRRWSQSRPRKGDGYERR